MSTGHLAHLLDGGNASQTAFTKRRKATTIQELVAPHQSFCPDWPQLARAIARPDSWALTPSMAIIRL
jgi:hypothetical protein